MGISCMSNTKQLLLAWKMYADDNNNRLSPTYAGPDGRVGSWVTGWLDWTTSSDNTNVTFLQDEPYSMFARYLGRAYKVFKCPEDRFLSAEQSALGWSERVRSVSGSVCMGGNTDPRNSIYKQVRKIQDLRYPTPAETLVFMDEHPDSINDACFFSPSLNNIGDMPATYHAGATGVAFADGHSEIHKWRGKIKAIAALQIRPGNTGLNSTCPNGDPDKDWLAFHTARKSTNSTPTAF